MNRANSVNRVAMSVDSNELRTSSHACTVKPFVTH